MSNVKVLDSAADQLLGALLLQPSSINLIDVSESDFFHHWHADCFAEISKMVRRQEEVTFVTVANSLTRQKKKRKPHQDWVEYLESLYVSTPTAANIGAYSKIIREEARRRRALEAIEKFQHEEEDLSVLIRNLMDVEVTQRDKSRRISEEIPELINEIDRMQHGENPGITTGFRKLDVYMGGWMPGDLYIIAARTSSGKTALLGNFSMAIMDRPHGFISVEQPGRQLLQRYCAMLAKVNAQYIRLGRLKDDDWRDIADIAFRKLEDARIFINDESRLTAEDIGRIARRWKYNEGIEALFVDYIQRLRPINPKDSTADQIAATCRELKSIGLELNIPVIAAAQFNRGVENRGDHRPQLADLKGSGGIEEEGDGVVAIYRPSMYDKNFTDKTLTELIILKNRHGPLGYTEVDFFADQMRFVTRLSDEERIAAPQYKDFL